MIIQAHTFHESPGIYQDMVVYPWIPGLMISMVFFCNINASTVMCSKSNKSWFLSYSSSSMSARICLDRDYRTVNWLQSWAKIRPYWSSNPDPYQFHCNIKVLSQSVLSDNIDHRLESLTQGYPGSSNPYSSRPLKANKTVVRESLASNKSERFGFVKRKVSSRLTSSRLKANIFRVNMVMKIKITAGAIFRICIFRRVWFIKCKP